MVFPTAGALRGRIKEVAATISWHLFSVRLVIRFFYYNPRNQFVRRWWETRWIRVALRMWRDELTARNEFLVDNYSEHEGVGNHARDVLLLPESDWFALPSSDRPDWCFLEVEEVAGGHGFNDLPEAGEHGYRLPVDRGEHSDPVEDGDRWGGGLGLRDDEPFEWDLGEFATNNPDFTSDDHVGGEPEAAVGGVTVGVMTRME